MKGSSWITLSDAAVRAGLNRERLLRLIQGGSIRGRRNVTGRWEVESASVARYLGARASASGAAVKP